MRCRYAAVKSGCVGGNEPEMLRLSSLVVHHILGVIEATTALHLAAMAGVGGFGSSRSGASRLADLALRDPVADTNDHAGNITIMRTIRKFTLRRRACEKIVGDESTS